MVLRGLAIDIGVHSRIVNAILWFSNSLLVSITKEMLDGIEIIATAIILLFHCSADAESYKYCKRCNCDQGHCSSPL